MARVDRRRGAEAIGNLFADESIGYNRQGSCAVTKELLPKFRTESAANVSLHESGVLMVEANLLKKRDGAPNVLISWFGGALCKAVKRLFVEKQLFRALELRYESLTEGRPVWALSSEQLYWSRMTRLADVENNSGNTLGQGQLRLAGED